MVASITGLGFSSTFTSSRGMHACKLLYITLNLTGKCYHHEGSIKKRNRSCWKPCVFCQKRNKIHVQSILSHESIIMFYLEQYVCFLKLYENMYWNNENSICFLSKIRKLKEFLSCLIVTNLSVRHIVNFCETWLPPFHASALCSFMTTLEQTEVFSQGKEQCWWETGLRFHSNKK